MITWIKKIWRKLRAPPHIVVQCDHHVEVLCARIKVADEERFNARAFGSSQALEGYLRRRLCDQLAEELFRNTEVVLWSDYREDSFATTYTVRIKVVLDNKKEPK
jgi:hypothetical protein